MVFSFLLIFYAGDIIYIMLHSHPGEISRSAQEGLNKPTARKSEQFSCFVENNLDLPSGGTSG